MSPPFISVLPAIVRKLGCVAVAQVEYLVNKFDVQIRYFSFFCDRQYKPLKFFELKRDLQQFSPKRTTPMVGALLQERPYDCGLFT